MAVSRRLAVLSSLSASFIWGFTFLSIKVALKAFPPMSLGLARFAVAGVLLAGLLAARGRLPHLDRTDAARMAASGLLGVTAYFFFENNGILRISASEASLMTATIPVFTLLAEATLLAEGTLLAESSFLRARLSAARAVGAALSVAGIGLVVAESFRFSRSPAGYLYMLLAAFAWVGYGFLTRPLASRYDRLEITFWQSLFGMAGFVPFALFETVTWAAFGWGVGLNVLFLGIFGSALATVFYVTGLEVLGPGVVNVHINLIPVVSVAASFALLGERLSPLQAAGGVVVVGGVYLATGISTRRTSSG